jgi:hypothetical protein
VVRALLLPPKSMFEQSGGGAMIGAEGENDTEKGRRGDAERQKVDEGSSHTNQAVRSVLVHLLLY